eukprot:9274491-Alexandrium_andersonii.AAC.1
MDSCNLPPASWTSCDIGAAAGPSARSTGLGPSPPPWRRSCAAATCAVAGSRSRARTANRSCSPAWSR